MVLTPNDPEYQDVLDDLISAQGIAERVSVDQATVYTWKNQTRGFPRPVHTSSIGNLWSWREVSGWLYRTGRLRDQEAALLDRLGARSRAES